MRVAVAAEEEVVFVLAVDGTFNTSAKAPA
jgi:hypothetical protein